MRSERTQTPVVALVDDVLTMGLPAIVEKLRQGSSAISGIAA
jgi:hypothetical protein